VAEDRNQTVKNQLLKKRQETARKKVPLAPSEMVDDALSRGAAGAGRWLKKNFATVQWVIVAAIAGGIGVALYERHSDKSAEQATSELMKGTLSERGRISSSSQSKPEDEGPEDPTPVFKSADERRDTALASYRKVVSTYPGTGAAILARMGEAGLVFDKRDWDGAIAAYREVKESALAKADVSVRGRAMEAIGLALESKGDIDGAIKSFHELENTDVRGMKELGMYQQARLLFGKGETDQAKALLLSAREKIKDPAGSSSGPLGPSHPFAFLESQIDDLLRRIDPAAIPPTPPSMPTGMPIGDPSKMSPDQLQRLQEQLRKAMQDAAKNKVPPPAPAPAPAGSK
jgi:hypothetical protein